MKSFQGLEEQAYNGFEAACGTTNVSAEAITATIHGVSAFSIAISLKRIADSLEKIQKSGLTCFDGNAI